MALSCVACNKNDKNTNGNNNNNGNPNSKVTVTATKNGNELDVTIVELIDNAFVPAGWAISSGYNSSVNLFALSVSQVGLPGDFSLLVYKQMPSFAKGSYSLKGEQLDNTAYRSVNVGGNMTYSATSGTLKIDKIESVGSAAGITANYIDGSLSFDAVNPSDSSDVIHVEAVLTGVATSEQ